MDSYKLSSEYRLQPLSFVADKFDKIRHGDDIMDEMKGNVFKDLVGLVVYHVSNGTVDEVKAFFDKIEPEIKDMNKMVYVELSPSARAVREHGEIGGTAVKPNQRTLIVSGVKYTITHEPMPAAYRSAKSVIIKAVSNNIRLLDADCMPKAKGVLEAELKEATKQEVPHAVKFARAMSTALQEIQPTLEGEGGTELVLRLQKEMNDYLSGVIDNEQL